MENKSQQSEMQMVLEEVQNLKRMVDLLTGVVRRDKIHDTWISEDDAALMLGLAPRTLRRHCSSSSLPIHFRNTNGRNWQFNRKDILVFMKNSSTML